MAEAKNSLFLEAADVPAIRACVRDAFGRRGGIEVVQGGENVLLDGSLGVAQ